MNAEGNGYCITSKIPEISNQTAFDGICISINIVSDKNLQQQNQIQF